MGDRTYRAAVPARFIVACLLALAAGCGRDGVVGGAAVPPPPRTMHAAVVNTSVNAMIASIDAGTLSTVGPQIATYAASHNFQTIFIFLPWNDTHTNLPQQDPATVAAVNQLASVATLYILAGNRNWQLTPTVVPQVVQDLKKVGQMYPQFSGITFDLEPQALPSWKTDRQATITQYVQFLNTLLVSPGGYGFRTTAVAVAPYYAKQYNSNGTASPSLLQQVQSIYAVKALYVMNFNSPETLQERGASPLALSQIQKPFWWGSTCDAGAPPGVSYYGTSAATFIAEMGQLATFVQSNNSNYQYLFVHAWNTENTSLQTVLP